MLTFDFNDGQKHIVALVGAGGKTTLMYELADYYASLGLKVLVTTSTHILQPQATSLPFASLHQEMLAEDGYLRAELWAHSLEEARELWQRSCFAVVGAEEIGTHKLMAVPTEAWAQYMTEADIIFCEADGAKHKPCKVPRAGEPVIYDACTDVIGVVGMDALGGRVQDVCFRTEQVCELLACDGEHILTEADIAKILLSDNGTHKNVGNLPYYIVLNKCDTEELRQRAGRIKRLLISAGVPAENIVLRGKTI